jgi:hypothetical protein
MLPGSPMLWLVLVLGAALPATYGITKTKAMWEAKAAYDKGVEAGKGLAATAALSAATETARAEREAEATNSPTPTQHEALIALCKKDRNCRSRGKL